MTHGFMPRFEVFENSPKKAEGSSAGRGPPPGTLLYCRAMKTSSGPVSAVQQDVVLAMAREVLEIEARAISTLIERLDGQFAEAVGMVRACRGRVIVSGMGKSGHIA